eukprot:2464288-Amphidinium_carterae.1
MYAWATLPDFCSSFCAAPAWDSLSNVGAKPTLLRFMDHVSALSYATIQTPRLPVMMQQVLHAP